LIKTTLIFIVKTYKTYISPFLPRSCRYFPSCSDYAIEALERYGAIKGMAMAVMRISRCNGYFKGGADPA
jgi:hypothetical protein